jgi:predicted nucleotidyltransferase
VDYAAPMTRDEAISALQAHATAIRACGATGVYLFGSTERNEAGTGSDLDIFVDYDPETRFSLLDLAAIKVLLEEEIGVEVDVTTRDSLHPMLRDDIERSAVRIL